MRLWQIIWAIYLLVLSGLPCEAFCQEEPATNQTARSDSSDHHREAACSPFCLCAACPGFTLPALARLVRTSASTGAPGFATMLPTYQAPHSLLVLGRIWHPPRLS